MSKFTSIAKALGIALAIFIVLMMISGIMFVGNFFTDSKGEENLIIKTIDDANFDTLDLDVDYVDLKVTVSDEFRLETNIKDISLENMGSSLKIASKLKFKWKNKNKVINLEIPRDLILKKVNLEIGAGKIDIYNLEADNWNVSLGVSKTYFSNIKSSGKARIENGMGALELDNCNFNTLDLKNGMGSSVVKATLGDNVRMENGLGSIDLNILDELDNFDIKLSNGMGSVTVNDKEIDENIVMTGSKKLELENGLGSINIHFIS